MPSEFISCDSTSCPSRRGCFRHPESGSAVAHQRFGHFDGFLSTTFHPMPVSCDQFLPVVQESGKVQFPLRVLPTWATCWQHGEVGSYLAPPYDERFLASYPTGCQVVSYSE